MSRTPRRGRRGGEAGPDRRCDCGQWVRRVRWDYRGRDCRQRGTATGGAAVSGGTAVSRGKRAGSTVSVLLALYGRGSVAQLAARLQEVDGVLAVRAVDSYADD